MKTVESLDEEESFSFKNYFVPLTTAKAITWIIIVGLIVYANSFVGQFLLDDQSQIVSNTFVHTILNIPSFFTGGTFFYVTSGAHLTSDYYRPLLSSTIAIIYTLFGTNTFFYHFIQTALHISNAVLLFYFLKRIFTKPISLFLSLIFLVHPIQVESVVYISSIEEELFTLFGMTALLLVRKNRNTIRNGILIFFFLLMSLLSKETGILFVFVLLLYKLLFYRKNLKLYAFFSIVLIGFYLFLYFYVAKIHFTPLPEIPIEVAPLATRLMTMPAIIFFYLSTFFFPLRLITGQMWLVASLSFWQFYFPLLIDSLFFATLIVIGIVF